MSPCISENFQKYKEILVSLESAAQTGYVHQVRNKKFRKKYSEKSFCPKKKFIFQKFVHAHLVLTTSLNWAFQRCQNLHIFLKTFRDTGGHAHFSKGALMTSLVMTQTLKNILFISVPYSMVHTIFFSYRPKKSTLQIDFCY